MRTADPADINQIYGYRILALSNKCKQIYVIDIVMQLFLKNRQYLDCYGIMQMYE